jgi:ABC-type branched-subunit amino acid transport system ATPase component
VVDELFAALERLREAAATLLIVDQMAGLALALADRAYVISNGSIVWSGGAQALHTDEGLRLRLLGV